MVNGLNESKTSGDTDLERFHPHSVIVDGLDLKAVREIAGGESIDRNRMYGLAIEFAAQNNAEFREFVANREVV